MLASITITISIFISSFPAFLYLADGYYKGKILTGLFYIFLFFLFLLVGVLFLKQFGIYFSLFIPIVLVAIILMSNNRK